MDDTVSISVEMTPNPNTEKFVFSQKLVQFGPYDFRTQEEAKLSPVILKLLNIPEVFSVFVSQNFLSITRKKQADWLLLEETILAILEQYLNTKEPLLESESPPAYFNAETYGLEEKIRIFLDQHIRPAVAQDGGDIIFKGFQSGVLSLQLQGACKGCPSSSLTLKLGIEAKLKQVIPEVTQVIQV